MLFASRHKECTTASELLHKVVALKCIQNHHTMSVPSTSHPASSTPSLATASQNFSSHLPASYSADLFENIENNEHKAISGAPIFFNSITAVLKNLAKAGVDPIVAENIALDRLYSQDANPLCDFSHPMFNGEQRDIVVKDILRKLHDHENFTIDGAPYPFDIKSALRYSEHLHSQIPPLETISPQHLAHEQSITLAALARFMAMREMNLYLIAMFSLENNNIEERVYHSALFWTYREAFKSFYYPKMPAPIPPQFQLTPSERQILRRYWNAGNRHVTTTECIFLARRCPSLAPFQVYGFFDKRRRREYNKYRGLKDDETLALETTQVWKKLRELKGGIDDDESDEDDELLIQREFLSKDDNKKLELLWQVGHRKPSRNECEILAAEMQMDNGEQIFAYFEDRRWHDEYQNRKRSCSSRR